ncbi:MAG: DUF5362 domain-containing protein [Calditrichaeota bacterium]|nr:DUF5362 domain-containing protein [Calditrichota bacterium]
MEEKEVVQQMSSPLYDAKGWLKLIGIVSIIYGVLMIFTIVGIVVCWLPIWMGVLLYGAASKIDAARSTGDSTAFLETMSKLKTYFIINGVLILIVIVGIVFAFVATGGAILSGISSLNY